MSFLKRLSNQTGAGFIEVVVGIVIVGITAAAIMQLASVTLPMVANVDQRIAFDGVINRINAWLQSEDTCRRMMGGPAALGGAPGPSAAIPAAGRVVVLLNPGDGSNYLGNGVPSPVPEWQIQPAGAGIQDGIFLEPLPGQNFLPNANNVAVLRVIMSPSRAVGVRATGTAGSAASHMLRFSLRLDAGMRVQTCGALAQTSYAVGGAEVLGAPMPVCGNDYAPRSDGSKIECIRVRCSGNDGNGAPLVPRRVDPMGVVCCPAFPAPCP